MDVFHEKTKKENQHTSIQAGCDCNQKMKKKRTNENMPLGLAMALAQNPSAMEKYSTLDAKNKENLLSQAKNITSKDEMQSLVNSIANSQIQS
ncbi:MAG: hypothetical protein GX303_03750 [Clostridiales bacterium]|nr:hypothetical protein [Clostridiales bacterium]